MPGPIDYLAQAKAAHRSGQISDAVERYEQALRLNPACWEAHFLLGVCRDQLGQAELAIASLSRAIALEPRQSAVHNHLGTVLARMGRTGEAIGHFRQAQELDPASADAADNLHQALALEENNRGNTLAARGELDEAIGCYRRALELAPDYAEAHNNLGTALGEQGQFDEAIACHRRALELSPRLAAAHNGLGAELARQGRHDEALRHYHWALAIKPDFAAARVNLAAVHLARQQPDEAIACYRAALAAEPSHALALHNLGAVLQKRGRHAEALACFDKLIATDPAGTPAHLGRATALQELGDYRAALASYHEALRLAPDDALVCSYLGAAYGDVGQRDKAIEYCRRAIALQPDLAAAHGNLAASLQSLGRLDQAIAANRRALELAPDNAACHSNLLYQLNYAPDATPASLFAEHRAWGRKHADPLTAVRAPHANDRTADRRLRVGYVSPYFRGHAVTFFSEPILAAHDHARFEIFCYADVPLPDDVTRRLQGHADRWRDTMGQSDQEVSELVRRDQIDILVDLTGHIASGNRLLLFARKPAPVQVTYIGYQNTTGMTAMDYRLTDSYADPPGLTDEFHTEKLVRLPRTFFCYLPSSDAPAVTPPPAIANGYVTFASVNNFNKVTPRLLNAWAALLKRVPQSRLLLRADITDSLRQTLWETFEAQGVGRERLELTDWMPRHEYLELINRADIALDPFPFNGHTTTCDCLWQGVPVVTLSGDSYVTRFGGSALVTLGLGDLIAHTTDEYVDIAAGLAHDVPRLSALRSDLRARMAASPLLDFVTFTRNLEAEYRRMWAAWCAAEPEPPSFC